VFVNDNGGAWNNSSSNAPLRGTKGTPFEGGIRVPFLMQWPDVLPGGVTYDKPVSTLDIFATVTAAVGSPAPERPLDGVDLVPFLTERTDAPHRELFWRRKKNLAARVDDWKLVVYKAKPAMLFNILADEREEHDLAGQHPDVVERLSARYAAWEAEMIPPRWGSSAVDPKPGR
jgi:arylsulfatase A-like enzyme